MSNILVTKYQFNKILNSLTEDAVSSDKKRDVKWTIDNVKNEAKRYDNITDFRINSLSAYIAATRFGILDELFPDRQKYLKWDEESVKDEAKKYNNITDFQKNSSRAYRVALKLGILHKLFPKKNKEGILSSADAMRKIVSVLKINGYNDEQVIDTIIKLRQKDKKTYLDVTELSYEPKYIESVEKMMSI